MTDWKHYILETQLIEYLSQADYVPLRLDEIAAALNVDAAGLPQLKETAQRLQQEGGFRCSDPLF